MPTEKPMIKDEKKKENHTSKVSQKPAKKLPFWGPQLVDVRLGNTEKKLQGFATRIGSWTPGIRDAVNRAVGAIVGLRSEIHKLPPDFKVPSKRATKLSIEPGTEVRIREKHAKLYEDLLPVSGPLKVLGYNGQRLALETGDGKIYVPRGHVEVVAEKTV